MSIAFQGHGNSSNNSAILEPVISVKYILYFFRFTLYTNLFASMLFLEVNWILDSVTIFYPDAENVFIITDFCNLAVLLFILVNFMCKKRTWIMIKKRLVLILTAHSDVCSSRVSSRCCGSRVSMILELGWQRTSCWNGPSERSD